MPRSFLLRRSQDDGRANSKMQIDGRHSRLLPQTAAKLQRSPFEKDSKKKDNCFQSLTDQSALLNDPAFAVPYTYQSYIDGESFQRNNNLTTMKTEAGSFKDSKDQGGLDTVADCTPQLSQADEEAAVKPSDGMGKTKGAVSGSKPVYRCEQCGKTFKTKYTLTIHLKMPNHTGARPFVCNICGKGFRLSSTLCRHKIIHTSDKPHKCHICQKAFNRSSTLKTHVRTHSEKKEFVCDVCGKGFHQKGNLRNHILIHTGEKPYRCRLCNKAFNKLSNLKFHLHIHTDNTPYRCRYCKTAFSRRCDLKQHIRTTHGEQMDDEYFDDET